MAEPQPLMDDVNLLGQARLRIMKRFQCSKDEATIRLRDFLQALIEPLEPQDHPPIPHPYPPLRPILLPGNSPIALPNKKPTYVDFDLNSTISNRIPISLSEYAVGKIRNIEYVELWYFTLEGRNNASKAILDTNSRLALQPIKASGASRNAVVDESLSWEQIMTARYTLVTTASEVGWDQKLTLALAEFYMRLETAKAHGNDTRALILYHAACRRQWHDALKGRGKPFNISNFNEELYQRFEDQVRDHDLQGMIKETSDLQRQASKK